MAARHIITLSRLDQDTISRLIRRSVEFASGEGEQEQPLKSKVVGILFPRPSTRTRTAFSVAALKLGAEIVTYGRDDLQLSTGETLEDTGRVFSGYLDALVVRTNEPEEQMEILASQGTMPVINAMSAEEHPTQALADLSTMLAQFGRVEGLRVLYLGEGNNSASALGYALGHFPDNELTLMTPEGYGLSDEMLQSIRSLASRNGTRVEQIHDLKALPVDVDVVYTTRWNTMGAPKATPNWEQLFEPFSVTRELMARVSKAQGTMFMHDLPAVRGGDVTSEVLDGPQSLAWRQARHKLWSAMAILEWVMERDAIL